MAEEHLCSKCCYLTILGIKGNYKYLARFEIYHIHPGVLSRVLTHFRCGFNPRHYTFSVYWGPPNLKF